MADSPNPFPHPFSGHSDPQRYREQLRVMASALMCSMWQCACAIQTSSRTIELEFYSPYEASYLLDLVGEIQRSPIMSNLWAGEC